MRIRTPRGFYKDLSPDAAVIWEVLEDDGVRFMLEPATIKQHGAPPNPYGLDIAYRREPGLPSGGRRDHYQPWWVVVAQKHGDCEDLAMFLAAYLRFSGIDPGAVVGLIEWPGGGWHAIVLRSTGYSTEADTFQIYELPEGARVYGGPSLGWDPEGVYIQDPSYALGMRDSSKDAIYHPRVKLTQREPRSPFAGDPYIPFELAGSTADLYARLDAWAS